MTLAERNDAVSTTSSPLPLVNDSPTAVWRSRLPRLMSLVVLVGLLVGYALFLRSHYEPAIIHPDAHGYWAQARLIVETGHSWFKAESNAQYIGMHWLIAPGDTLISRYPPGLPLAIGVVWKLFGWEASTLVNPVLSVLTLLGIYLIVKRLASAAWGLVAVVLLAINPAFTVYALTNISHMAVAFCLVWGVHLLLVWSEKGKIWTIFLAGLVLGCIPSIRYADAIVALGVLAFMLWHVRAFPKIGWHYLAAVVGAAIPIVPLLIRNQMLLGGFWKTGYSLTNEDTGFGWDYFSNHAISYLQMLQGSGMGILFALGLLGMIWMVWVKGARPAGVMLLLCAVPFLLVYMSYYWARGVGGGNTAAEGMRFLVPLVPIFVLSGVWAMRQMTLSAPLGMKLLAPLVVISLQVLMYGQSTLDDLTRSAERKQLLAIASREVAAVAQEGDVILASGGLLQQLDYVKSWKLADSTVVSGGGRGMGGGGFPMQGGGMPGGAMPGGGMPGGFDPAMAPRGGPDGPFPPTDPMDNRRGESRRGDNNARVDNNRTEPARPAAARDNTRDAGRDNPRDAGRRGMGRTQDPDAPSPMQAEKREARANLYKGSTEERQRQFRNDLIKWANGKAIYVIGSESDLGRLIPGVPRDQLEIVRQINLPAPPQVQEEDDRPGGFGGRAGANTRQRRGGGGMFGGGLMPGQKLIIARWNPDSSLSAQ